MPMCVFVCVYICIYISVQRLADSVYLYIATRRFGLQLLRLHVHGHLSEHVQTTVFLPQLVPLQTLESFDSSLPGYHALRNGGAGASAAPRAADRGLSVPQPAE